MTKGNMQSCGITNPSPAQGHIPVNPVSIRRTELRDDGLRTTAKYNSVVVNV